MKRNIRNKTIKLGISTKDLIELLRSKGYKMAYINPGYEKTPLEEIPANEKEYL